MTTVDTSHLSPAAQGLLDKTDDIRIKAIQRKRWIAHEPARILLEVMRQILQQPRGDRMAGLFLTAESGMGKTTLVKKFVGLNGPRHRIDGNPSHHPVVYVLMPEKLGSSQFFIEILRTLGAPVSTERRVSRAHHRETVLRLLAELRTKVLIVDEINSAKANSANEQREFLQLLRYLSNQLGIAILCTGIAESEFVLYAEPQLRSRMHHLVLPRWTADDELQLFVNLLVQSYPLRRPSPVQSAGICRLLIDRTGGITKAILEGLEYAAILAIQEGRERIDLDLLRQEAVWTPFAPAVRIPSRMLRQRADVPL